MKDKQTSLAAAVGGIPDAVRIGLGGNTLHRAPGAVVHEIVRQGKRGLEVVKTAGSYDVDLLCAAGCAAAISAGYIGYETPFGMARAYRRAVETGLVEAREHVCATVIAGLRAAIQGVPFMPVAGLQGSDLPAARNFRAVYDPYGDDEVYVVPALPLDVAIVHVQEADVFGNARIRGTRFEDDLMVKAAARVIVTAERIVAGESFVAAPESVTIPGFLVDAVVEAPGGAWPFSCATLYDYDADYLAAWAAAAADPDKASRFIEERIVSPSIAVA
jgi:glutaconate CoA-transferase subunit A